MVGADRVYEGTRASLHLEGVWYESLLGRMSQNLQSRILMGKEGPFYWKRTNRGMTLGPVDPSLIASI